MFHQASNGHRIRAGVVLGMVWPVVAAVASMAGAAEPDDMNPSKIQEHTNRLIHATSPYLVQHAHNPVDWYEWGPEAMAKAVKEDKPIFLSIGYSACHWCHVMAHESFEADDVAALLNAHFVSIKVDREERPDIDEIYMHYTTQRTGSGGWPMSLFLTPAGVPFWAGTYFPREQFKEILSGIHQEWQNERDNILNHAGQVESYLKTWAKGNDPLADVAPQEAISKAANFFADRFDPQDGGFNSGGNKFPPSMAMELMLREYARTGQDRLRQLVVLTLDRMAHGGIYDHLGGGICRYSTDPKWLVPHFEKMLYDQALVSGIYLDAYQVTGKRLYSRVAREIFDYVIGDLQSPEGGFYSTRDADSEGLEGKYYIWTVPEVVGVLGDDDGRLFCEFYDVTERGNWFESRGHAPAGAKNILNIKEPIEEFAAARSLDATELDRRLATMRGKLLAVRAERIPPGLDDKVLASWNGLMIASLAKGARVLDDPRYAAAAGRAADFVLSKMRKDGRLHRSYRNGTAHLTAYLSDYSCMIEGCLNLYEATFDVRWLDEAVALNDVLTAHYYDPSGGGYYFTADDGEALIARSKSPDDGAVPSGNAVQAANLIRMAIILDRKDLREQASSIFRAFAAGLTQSPFTRERSLCSLDMYYGPVKEIVLAGVPSEPRTQELIRTVYGRFLPNKVVCLSPVAESARKALWPRIPLLRNRTPIRDVPAAYVCENYVCQKPVTSPAELAAQLTPR
ncbi:MAG: thioredoxin domain-containing protein [Planctomycetes bacterium]|nr:thioredoxin domain-containing protein [Planctomycetota bacterium]